MISGAIGGQDMPVLPVPAAPLYIRSQSLLGVRTTSARDISRFWALVDKGFRLPPGLIHEAPLATAADAHATMSSGLSTGHRVLTVSR